MVKVQPPAKVTLRPDDGAELDEILFHGAA
jgi:hypothetical protein